MQKYTRWSAILVVLMLVLAACQSDGGSEGSEEPEESAAASEPAASAGGGGGTAADCDADEFGCVEIAEGDPIVIGYGARHHAAPTSRSAWTASTASRWRRRCAPRSPATRSSSTTRTTAAPPRVARPPRAPSLSEENIAARHRHQLLERRRSRPPRS